MSQNLQDRKNTYNEQDKEITDLQKKYNVDTQEVLNAVISADNDLGKAEEYLKKRTEKKWSTPPLLAHWTEDAGYRLHFFLANPQISFAHLAI